MRPSRFLLTLALGLVGLAPAARAQWSQVPEIPGRELFSLFVNGDTIATGADTTVHVITDGGVTWRHSSKPVAAVRAITATRVRNGRLYAGTFGQGVWTSDDLGQTWQAFNQGLVGGFEDSQLDVVDLKVRGDSLYAATAGAGVYLRRFAAPSAWQPTGTVFAPEQSENVNSLAVGGTRLLALAGSNGMVFRNDPGEADWTESDLDNIGIHAGLSAMTGAWTGTGWVVGTNFGVFLSTGGQEPWTPMGLGLGAIRWTAFTTQGGHLFAAFVTGTVAVMEQSGDNGATWTIDDVLPGIFVQGVGLSRGQLYASRGDGLWRRPSPALAVGPPVAGALRFSIAGAQPFTDRATFRFDLPMPGVATIELFDVMGRRTGVRASASSPAGAQQLSLDARDLRPGVYAARLTAGAAHAELRIVHVR